MQGVLYIVIALCTLVVGLIIGIFLERSKKPATDGVLKYSVDPDDGIYLFLEFPDENGPSLLLHKKHATFNVDTSDIISHD